jgi:hypothetical protein
VTPSSWVKDISVKKYFLQLKDRREEHHVLLNDLYVHTNLHGVTAQKTVKLVVRTTVRNSFITVSNRYRKISNHVINIKVRCCLQVLGQWYLVEEISASPGRPDKCAGIKLVRENNRSWDNLIMTGQESPDGSSIFNENHTIVIPDSVNTPNLWEQPGNFRFIF